MKRRQPKSDAEKRYGRKLRLRKLRLYAVLLFSSVLVLLLSIRLLDNSNSARLEPQIDRAVVQVAKLLPQLEQNEEALREAYRQMTESWEELLSHDAFSDADFALFVSSFASCFFLIHDSTPDDGVKYIKMCAHQTNGNSWQLSLADAIANS